MDLKQHTVIAKFDDLAGEPQRVDLIVDAPDEKTALFLAGLMAVSYTTGVRTRTLQLVVTEQEI